MAITNKLITFNKLTSFETQLAQGNILETSIVFIKDAKKIWTKGTYFDCSGGGDSIPIIDEIGSYFIETTSGTFNETQANVLKNKPAMFIAPVRTGVQSIPYILFSLQSLDTHPIYIGINDKTQYQLDYYLSDYGEFDITRKYSLYSNDLALKSDIPNTDDFATKDEIGYTTDFSVADIEAVYGRGITKPVNVQGLMSAIEANKPIIIPTNITDASQVGGNAVTMAKMENDGFIYLNVIVPYLDGVHKEYFIQIKITTAQLIKSGSNGSITLKELVAKTDLKTINGESILGSGNIDVQGGGDNRYFTEFTVEDFINACKNESNLVSNGLCDAIINNKIICVPYSLESYNSGYMIASCEYSYSEDSSDPHRFDCDLEINQITYNLFRIGNVVNNDTFSGSLPTSNCPRVVYLDSLILDFKDNTTYIFSSRTQVNDLIIIGAYFGKGTTIRFITGDNPSLEFVISYNVFWANGVIPDIEPNTWYELSLTSTDDENILAVLTPFKSV